MMSKESFYSPKEEHVMVRKLARNFAKTHLEPTALLRNRKEIFDKQLFKELGSQGLLGVCAQEEYLGTDLDPLASVIIHEELSFSDPGFCLAYLAHSILCVNNISQNCSAEQKAKYLPKLAAGEWVGAMAMSESQAGTDVLGMGTLGKRTSDGFLLNGRKMWITNGALENNETCDVLFLYAKTSLENKKSLSSFVVEKGQSGFSVGQVIKDKLGMRASVTAELVFDNCQIRQDQLVGSEGDAITHMMRNLELERLCLAAMSIGIAKRCLKVMINYAQERKAFGKSIDSFGQIQKYLADSYAQYQAARAYLYLTARKLSDTSKNNRLDSDGIKLLAATVGKNIADSAIQVLGGNGYVGEYVVERLWRDAKLLEIGGGTIEAHQKNMVKEMSKNPNLFLD